LLIPTLKLTSFLIPILKLASLFIPILKFTSFLILAWCLLIWFLQVRWICVFKE
jgi:hypothetical protein